MALLTNQLIRWFRKNKRDLPWRENPTPYCVWISEIMLQQTVVNAVIPYFRKWMEKYPDIAHLAKAKEAEVLRMWEGLGYYARARNIFKAAIEIEKKFGGRMPETWEEWRGLPGIGDYTASAIMSIAFGKPYPVLDANVRRVGRRILGMAAWDKKREKELLEFLREAMPRKNPGAFNEALMELGQKVCLPDKPLCEKCPVKRFCIGFEKNIQNLIPGKADRKITKKKTYLALFVSRGKLLIVKREKGILKDLWGFPEFQEEGEIASFIKKEGGRRFKETGKLKARIHYYTRFRDELIPFVYEVEKQFGGNAGSRRWVSFNELEKYPLPSVYRKILEELLLKTCPAKI
ncbi:A/G-specific adenine glycosylase [Candidatus Sumerlaeota bacterium]|nr:A/G-specific adenine glycosylase [Candidatus Sumerlaeota bacterium]